MDAHLTLARWAAEERGIDISERVKAIRSKGWKEASYDAFEDALRCAHGGYIGRMNDNLEDYRALCLKIGMEPDEVKIREIEEIAERISIENTLSSGPPQIQKTVIKAKEEVLEK
ncbi:MAG: hypothetical protein Q8N58_02220 [bacterium]|nr:hypothetical protein [bacterium]